MLGPIWSDANASELVDKSADSESGSLAKDIGYVTGGAIVGAVVGGICLPIGGSEIGAVVGGFVGGMLKDGGGDPAAG